MSLLDIEKMRSDSIDFRLSTLELGTAVRNSIAANEAYATTHQVRLVLVGALPPGEVLVDPDRLAQALANLISNASKFSPPSEAVELSIERREGWFRVNVRDHGPGIPKEFEERIFQRFAQADGSTTRHKGGTGLGLSITKVIIEKMGGRIGFTPAAGGGTIFHFDLPYLHPVNESADTGGSQGRVLICEDDFDTAQTLAALLGATGYHVHIAPTLERARRLLSEHHYDAVTLDMTLADGDGSSLLAELRAPGLSRQVPVVVVSGSERDLQSFGVTDVILKPFDATKLLAAVAKAATGQASVSPRLLHVEGDADLRRIVQKTLPDNWEIVSAESVRAARRLLSESSFDVVLLELSMPDGDGTALLDCAGRAQVILFSAQDASTDLSRRVAAALVKSRSTPAEVRDAVVAVIGRARRA